MLYLVSWSFILTLFRPDEPQHRVSIAALSAVLLRASQRKRLSRESAKGERGDKTRLGAATGGAGGSDDKSRSNSEMSMAAGFPNPQQVVQSSSVTGGLGGKLLPEKSSVISSFS